LRIRVLKFGGTSVRTAEARTTAALRVVSTREQGILPVVVVSAIGRRGEPYATDTLIHLLKDVDPSIVPEARELDLLLGCGEILSSVVFAQHLKSLGHKAMAIRGGQAGIFTDGIYGNARITLINPQGLFSVLKQGAIPVVCGFQGVYAQEGLPGHELTTLGRGGSDTTAAALGAALKAEAVEIFTDVDGVKTADPDFVPGAPTLRRVSYDEVAEIAHLGAKVVHPRAAEIAMKFQIPMWVKNTFTDDPGTEIVPKSQRSARRITGVAHTGKLVSLQMDLSLVEECHRMSFDAAVYELLAKYGFNLFMINISPTGIGWAVPREQYSTLVDLFDGLVLPLDGADDRLYVIQIGETASKGAATQISLMRSLGEPVVVPITITEGCTMVSLVGKNAVQQPGVFCRILEILDEAQIPVIQTTDSDYSLSVLIPESELRRGVALLHAAFGLSETE
jgi:aspartate kinase